MKKKQKEQPVNVISYYEEWYGQLIALLIKNKLISQSTDIAHERVRPFYNKGLSPTDCFNELFKN